MKHVPTFHFYSVICNFCGDFGDFVGDSSDFGDFSQSSHRCYWWNAVVAVIVCSELLYSCFFYSSVITNIFIQCFGDNLGIM